MDKISAYTNTADGNDEFTEGDPSQAIQATEVDEGWLNGVQRELLEVMTQMGLTPSSADDTLVWQAVQAIYGKTFAGTPQGNVAANVVRERCWDTSVSPPALYIATAADGTIGGTTWKRAYYYQSEIDAGNAPHRHGELVVDGVTFSTIQAAIDAVTTATVDSPTSSGSLARNSVFLPGKEYEETIDITSGFDGATIFGIGVGSHVWTEAADHALHVQNPAQNINLYNFWVDQSAASGSFDAVHIESGGEVRLDNMDVDFAPRHAIYVNASGCKINNTEVSGGGKTSGMKLDTGAVNAVVTNMRFNGITHGASADAIDLTASKCLLSNIAITNVNNRGLVISGDENVVQNIHIRGTTGDALQISGDNNHVTGFIDGDVTLTAASNNNLIDAKISGTFTDNGTGNTRRAQ